MVTPIAVGIGDNPVGDRGLGQGQQEGAFGFQDYLVGLQAGHYPMGMEEQLATQEEQSQPSTLIELLQAESNQQEEQLSTALEQFSDESTHRSGERNSFVEGLAASGTQNIVDAIEEGFSQLPVESNSKTVSATVPELFEGVQSLVHQGGGKMSVSLNPPHLGQMEIEVQTRGKNVEIEMTSESETAKSALESHFLELKRALESQQLEVAKLEVNVTRFSEGFASFADSGEFSSSDGYEQASNRYSELSNLGNPLSQSINRTDSAPIPTMGSDGIDIVI